MLVPLLSRTARRQPATSFSCSIHTSTPSQLSASASLSATTKHYRRHSSSKPSSPPNNDSAIPTSTGPAAKAASPATRKRSTSKAGRPKSKDIMVKALGAEPASSLPSVPSTQHLHSQDINLASFFSLHRPISLISPVPPISTSKAFSAIFAPSPKPRISETMYTLASAVRGFEKMIHGEQTQDTDLRSAVTQSSATNAEPTSQDAPLVSLNIEELARSFRPFNPPPPPVPMEEAFEVVQHPQQMMTEISDSLLQELDLPAAPAESRRRAIVPFFERMQHRRARWVERRREVHDAIWQALSVKRQRKLKMKKHKYKKLMRRTRNLRRRQDRL